MSGWTQCTPRPRSRQRATIVVWARPNKPEIRTRSFAFLSCPAPTRSRPLSHACWFWISLQHPHPSVHHDVDKVHRSFAWWLSVALGLAMTNLWSGSRRGDYVVGAHHLVVLVFEDVAMPYVTSCEACEGDDNPRDHAGIGSYRVLPARFIWGRRLRRA